MSELLVVAIMLTRDRSEYAKRAVELFRAQTYARKRLLIFDTSQVEIIGHLGKRMDAADTRTIGALRNAANQLATAADEIFVHWDDDDISHPNRITEQVALLQSSGADVVGYKEMLFWRANGEMQFDPSFGDGGFGKVTEDEDSISIETGPLIECGEAWLYTHPRTPVGSSLCYWRKTWERKPFQNTSHGEDEIFCRDLKCVAIGACGEPFHKVDDLSIWKNAPSFERAMDLIKHNPEHAERFSPRMVCRIHAGNTSPNYQGIERAEQNWKRVPAWDDYCRKVMG